MTEQATFDVRHGLLTIRVAAQTERYGPTTYRFVCKCGTVGGQTATPEGSRHLHRRHRND